MSYVSGADPRKHSGKRFKRQTKTQQEKFYDNFDRIFGNKEDNPIPRKSTNEDGAKS